MLQLAKSWTLRGGLAVVTPAVLIMLPLPWIDPPTLSTIFRRYLSSLSASTPGHRHIGVDQNQIAPPLAVAVIAAEDRKYPAHSGFDFQSIAAAIGEHKERTPGASTISQQVAKNLSLRPSRSLIRKGIEAYLTLAIEID